MLAQQQLETEIPEMPFAEEGEVRVETMWGEPAMELQRALGRLGYETGPVDGVVGPRTLAALQEFQRCNGLGPEGALGRSTRSLLHLDEGEMFDRGQPPELIREAGGVDRPGPADERENVAGSDPLDISSMPTVEDADEPLDADDQMPATVRSGDWQAAVSREECLAGVTPDRPRRGRHPLGR